MDSFIPALTPIPFLYIDASYFKVRTDGRYVNKALLIASGIRQDGYREILSADVADSEDESRWENLFEGLKARGLRGVKLVISDGHKGIQKAVKECFLGASWQISLTAVSESFDEVETCALCISCVPSSRTSRRRIEKRWHTCRRTLSKTKARCRNWPLFSTRKDIPNQQKPLIAFDSTYGITRLFPDLTVD